MYATIRKGQLARDSKSTVRDVLAFLEEAIPQVSKIAGFISAYAVQTGEREVTTINFFETAEGAAEANRFAKEAVASSRDRLGPVSLELSVGEVRLQHGASLVSGVAAGR